jgi:hypothetical protein
MALLEDGGNFKRCGPMEGIKSLGQDNKEIVGILPLLSLFVSPPP